MGEVGSGTSLWKYTNLYELKVPRRKFKRTRRIYSFFFLLFVFSVSGTRLRLPYSKFLVTQRPKHTDGLKSSVSRRVLSPNLRSSGSLSLTLPGRVPWSLLSGPDIRASSPTSLSYLMPHLARLAPRDQPDVDKGLNPRR